MSKQSTRSEANQPVRGKNDQRGFTLIEMLVSIALFLIVMGSVYGLLAVARRGRSTTNQRTELIKSVRVAIDSMQRDALNVGYSFPTTIPAMLPDNKISTLLGVPADTNTTRDLMPPVIAGRSVNTNALSGVNTDQVSFVYRDPNFNTDAAGNSQIFQVNWDPTNPPNINSVVPVSGSNAACSVNDLMLITGKNSTAVGVVTAKPDASRIQFANGDILGFNSPTAPDDPFRNVALPAGIRRVNLITYRVKNDGTLVRLVYANSSAATVANPAQEQPLVYGVEAMTFVYVLDDGTVTPNPLAGPDGIPGNTDDIPANQLEVRQIRLTLTARSTEKDPSGQYYKVTMTSTFSTRNLGYTAS
jgi:prepilin-type N-terminal cleavage/methylation domain-containing protein